MPTPSHTSRHAPLPFYLLLITLSVPLSLAQLPPSLQIPVSRPPIYDLVDREFYDCCRRQGVTDVIGWCNFRCLDTGEVANIPDSESYAEAHDFNVCLYRPAGADVVKCCHDKGIFRGTPCSYTLCTPNYSITWMARRAREEHLGKGSRRSRSSRGSRGSGGSRGSENSRSDGSSGESRHKRAAHSGSWEDEVERNQTICEDGSALAEERRRLSYACWRDRHAEAIYIREAGMG